MRLNLFQRRALILAALWCAGVGGCYGALAFIEWDWTPGFVSRLIIASVTVYLTILLLPLLANGRPRP